MTPRALKNFFAENFGSDDSATFTYAEVKEKMDKLFNLVKKETKKQLKDKNAPKRGLSSWVFFCQETRQEIVDENKDIKMTEVTKKLSEKWGELSADEKKPFEKMAEKDKKRYAKEMEKYTPPKVVELPSDEAEKPKRKKSNYLRFSTAMKGNAKLKGLAGGPRMAKLAEMWGKMSDKEKAKYGESSEGEEKVPKKTEKKTNTKKTEKKTNTPKGKAFDLFLKDNRDLVDVKRLTADQKNAIIDLWENDEILRSNYEELSKFKPTETKPSDEETSDDAVSSEQREESKEEVENDPPFEDVSEDDEEESPKSPKTVLKLPQLDKKPLDIVFEAETLAKLPKKKKPLTEQEIITCAFHLYVDDFKKAIGSCGKVRVKNSDIHITDGGHWNKNTPTRAFYCDLAREVLCN